jgi:hypothetical protein
MDLKQKVSGHFRRTCKDQLVLRERQGALALMAKREAMERLRQQRQSRVQLGQPVLQVQLVLREPLGQQVRQDREVRERQGHRVPMEVLERLAQKVRLEQLDLLDFRARQVLLD